MSPKTTNIAFINPTNDPLVISVVVVDIDETPMLHEYPIHFEPILLDVSQVVNEPPPFVVPPEGS